LYFYSIKLFSTWQGTPLGNNSLIPNHLLFYTEALEYVKWIGEYRLLKRLYEKAETLREIRFAN
jgi:hypothetical protein